ncbi:MAG: ATP-dependent Clp protease proteolytic subunit, partial [Ignavibacteriaceae bacterium]
AIDCPGAWTAMRTQTDKPVVLGRMAAHVVRPPAIGEPTISYGWPGERTGRRHTGKPLEQIHKDCERDHFLSAQEAKEYKIIDTILDKRIPLTKK